ncbi:MAG TPA: GatB/YqeY domain-containing protein [Candidatus Udaeobacter sp.]|jgi:uncharacterized protein YqeY|nr:GatB/YqeY domain-containing protein [Candidatus Udaeobacter sp.]
MSDPSILDRLQSDMATAMKAKDAETLSTLRMLKAALMEAKTRKPKDEMLSEDESIEVLQRYVKKRRESIEEFTRLGLADRVPSEKKEIEVTQRYLPQGLSEDEVLREVREAIRSTGAASPKDMGRVIGAVMGKLKGRAEGSTVSRLVKQELGGS